MLIFSFNQFVAGTQPINSIAFVYDGINFGASDFAYSAYSMVRNTVKTIIFFACIKCVSEPEFDAVFSSC